MLKKFEIQAIHFNIDDDLQKHVTKKIGGLDRYVLRRSRESAHAEVFLKENTAKGDSHYTCEVTFFLPHETIVVKESAKNIYTAVDMVENRIKQKLQTYKDKHDGRLRRHLVARFRRKTS
jgi:ribosomal subunit interface protein